MQHCPDLALARRCLEAHPPPGRLLLCGITGAHQYGFPSADSDLDIKGIQQLPTVTLLGLHAPVETYNATIRFEGTECDVTCNEVRPALALLLAGNGNMLERIQSPFQLLQTDEASRLRDLACGAISKRFHRHYAGFFRRMCFEHERSQFASAKTLLYVYRVALTGVHLLGSRQLETDVTVLSVLYGFSEVRELVAFKVAQGEHARVPAADDRLHRANWPRLEAALQDAHDGSQLPDEAHNAAACEAWLIELRRRQLDY